MEKVWIGGEWRSCTVTTSEDRLSKIIISNELITIPTRGAGAHPGWESPDRRRVLANGESRRPGGGTRSILSRPITSCDLLHV